MSRRMVLGVMAALALAGCAERETILPGERLSPRDILPGRPPEEPRPRTTAFRAPPTIAPADWPVRGRTLAHRPGNLALPASPRLVWQTGIGKGNDRRHRITADPVVAAGRVFAMDSRARLTAVALADGRQLWQRDLALPGEREDDASGGGLAVVDGVVYATTGFGQLVALDVATGDELWRQDLGAPATAPIAADGVVYVAGRDGTAWALRARDGRVIWTIPTIPPQQARMDGGGPALAGVRAVFPFANGDLIGVLRRAGLRVWTFTVAGGRLGRGWGDITDITADPVIDGDRVYAGTLAGRTVAVDLSSGEELWSLPEGVSGSMLLVGGSLFQVNDENELLRIDAQTGAVIWRRQLPGFTRERLRRRAAVHVHFGPILANGRLLLASSDGRVRLFDPATGEPAGGFALPAPASSDPVIAGGTLLLVTGRGTLAAFR